MVTLASTSPESGSSREMTGAGMVTVKADSGARLPTGRPYYHRPREVAPDGTLV